MQNFEAYCNIKWLCTLSTPSHQVAFDAFERKLPLELDLYR